MIDLYRYKSDVILLFHLSLGVLAGLYPQLVYFWVMIVFLLGIYSTLKQGAAVPVYLVAAYLAGIELLGRMSSSGLPHEFIKYAITLILVSALFFKKRKAIPRAFIVFVLLLIPATFLTNGGSFEETRQLISGNVSGPACLAVSAIYFYERKFDPTALRKIFLAILYPLGSIVGYLIIKTPDLSEIEFGFQSNFATSIYGPNQMSSILGLGILLIGQAYILKVRLFASHLISLAFVSILLFRGLLTFSRGGMLTAGILLVIIFLYSSFRAGFNVSMLRIIFLTAIFSIGAFVAFDYTNKLTDNALYGRYTGVKNGKQIEDLDKLTSGRTTIMYIDWEIFKDNMLTGIGPGMGKYFRLQYGYSVEVAAHNEFSRILAEHGLFGLFAIIILLGAPIRQFYKDKKVVERVIVIAFIGFCFVFMTHAATRIAAPCFLYGLAFIKIVPTLFPRLVHNDIILRQHSLQPR
jgi:O-antigen ligase